MVLTRTSVCEFGWPAPDFTLPGVDGADHALASEKGAKGTVVMFICNHCPYVQAVLDDIIRDARDLAPEGVNFIAVMSNDTEAYPDDGFERMRELAERRGFPFPYLLDADQSVARRYEAVCTPDFFGFDADLRLQYRGRITELRGLKPVAGARRDLYEAMRQVARTGHGPEHQVPGMGCSIKWRQD